MFVGATTVTTNGAGNATYDATFGTAVAAELGADVHGHARNAGRHVGVLGLRGDRGRRLARRRRPARGADAAAARPNPFNPRTTLVVRDAEAGAVEFTVHDLAGNRVATLVSGSLEAGPHEVAWSGVDDGGRPVPSGVYFARLVADGESRTGKLVLLK